MHQKKKKKKSEKFFTTAVYHPNCQPAAAGHKMVFEPDSHSRLDDPLIEILFRYTLIGLLRFPK